MPIYLGFEGKPSPGTTEEWEAQIATSNQVLAPMVLDRVQRAAVTINKKEIAGVVVREVEPRDSSIIRQGQIIINY